MTTQPTLSRWPREVGEGCAVELTHLPTSWAPFHPFSGGQQGHERVRSGAHNKSMPTLYISDLDGTLLDNSGTLSRNRRGLRLCRDAGGYGLEIHGCQRSKRGVDGGNIARRPYLAADCRVQRCVHIRPASTGRRHEIVNSIRPEVAANIYARILNAGATPVVSTFTGTDDRAYYCDIANEGMRWYVDDRISNGDKRWVRLGDLAESLCDQVVCLTVIGLRPALAALEDELIDEFGAEIETHLFESLYSAGWHWLTVHDWRATKARAIATLRETYGLNNHELAVFGDQNNDIKMFEVADRAIAVANATEELRACSTQVIGANTADSVVGFIEAEWSRAQPAPL